MSAAATRVIASMEPISAMHWKTFDPFLFCAHHTDNYPAGTPTADPEALVLDSKYMAGRNVGSDFSEKNGFSLYHGTSGVPGFPNHPHFGFETVSIIDKGVVDHSDSFGQTARYGDGDVQWLTAGNGIQHAEMFPLRSTETNNPMEMFQLWLNLPKASKTAPPHFTIAWAEDQPVWQDGGASLTLIGGQFMGLTGVPPPPNSYAANPDNEVVIARVRLEPKGKITLPAASSAAATRALYFYSGANLLVQGTTRIEKKLVMLKLLSDREVTLEATDTACDLLFLQGKPINEPVVQHGPFVTSSKEQLEQVFDRFQRTRFGGWNWGKPDPVHPRSQGRFYKLKGGSKVEPPSKRQKDGL